MTTETAEALWPYALEVYGRPGVEPLLLRLQDDHGQCVLLLLWSLWMAATGRAIDAPTVAACVELARAWQDAAVAPLRRLRRDLKGRASQTRLQARIRTGVQALELEAERMLLQMLEESSPTPSGAQAAPDAALAQAIAAWGGEAPPARLLQQLAALGA
ncbi:MAG TPA: TIGR02444 family protein [Caulobacteraceae bacterium]|nr:TIGR02444 family protein [Caulobacteraceae bacterium]